jgi:long-chain acyl-CoA synthetase
MTIYDQRPWTARYDAYVPKSLAPYPNLVMHDYLRKAAQNHPSQPVLLTTAKLPVVGRQTSSITYAQLDAASDALAAALVDFGLKKGDRVAVVMPNSTAFGITYFAILKAGGVVAATNPTYPPSKMQYQIDDCDAEFVICISLFYNLIKSIQSGTKVRKVIVANIKEYMAPLAKLLFTLAREKKDGHRVELAPGDVAFQEVLKQYAGRKPNVSVTPDDLALFQYTGGTTGVSKGAMSTHRALVSNTTQLQTWTGIAAGKLANVDMKPTDALYLGALPMFHAYGLVALLTQAVASGGRILLIPNPRDVDEVVDVIDFYKPNVFLGVPALYNAVNNHPRVTSGEVSLKSFVFNSSGAAALPPATKREFEARAGGVISEGFGMSETPVATHSNPLTGETRVGSIGLPLPDVDCRIVSLDDGVTPMPVGEAGELVIHALNLMIGYHKLPTETSNALRDLDGKRWLYTGDIAYMDEDGYFYIVDRKKDMALIGGFNVYPNVVEKVIKDHPAVLEVGVAAIPHPEKIGQESLKAWIVKQPDASLTEADVIAHCEKFLAPYEVPRRISFINELPKTTVGKTLRRELIQMEMQEFEKPRTPERG